MLELQCATCSANDLGYNADKFTWIVLKKTGNFKEKKVLFTGVPLGGRAIITGFETLEVDRIETSICSSCVENLKNDAEKMTEKKIKDEREHNKSIQTFCKFTSIISFICIVFSYLYLQFINHWTGDHFLNWVLLISPFVLFFSLLSFFIAKCDPKVDSHEILADLISKEHVKNIKSIVAGSEIYPEAKILIGDECPKKNSNEYFVLGLERYNKDNYKGYALFHIDKTMDAPGGSNRVDMELEELRGIAMEETFEDLNFEDNDCIEEILEHPIFGDNDCKGDIGKWILR